MTDKLIDPRIMLAAVQIERDELRAENERLTEQYEQILVVYDRQRAKIERLRAIVNAARDFLRHHERGQPGMPDTLYPMTYGALDEWHAEWDRRLQALADAFAESYTNA